MPTFTWPHAHLPHALCDHLKLATAAESRVTTEIPRDRAYPLLVVQEAGLGRLGTDAAIQADEPRLQIDAWAATKLVAAALAAEVFRLLDARFAGALKDTTLLTEDEANPGDFYQSKIERIGRSGGGAPFFDEYARVWRVTQFMNVKVNL
ncbi:MAG: tail completion protein gp17 [Thermoleophilia bacterium]